MSAALISKVAKIFNFNNEDKNNSKNKIYGAKELKGILSSNAYKSFGIAMGSFVLLIGTYVLINGLNKSINDVRNLEIQPLVFTYCPIGLESRVVENKSKLPQSKGSGESQATGSKGATSPDGKGVYTPTNNDVNLAGMGNVNLPIGDGLSDLLGELTKDIFPGKGDKSIGNGGGNGGGNDDDNFQAVEVEPKVDMSKLQGLIEYPTIAKKSNIEGRVIIKVLVKADGTVGKYMIEHSENIMLNNAALDAITKYGKFEPAIQNDKRVDCWISIPINFRLR